MPPRPESSLPNTNNLAAALIPALALAFQQRRWRWAAIFLVVLLLTASRASMIAAALGAGLCAALLSGRLRFSWRTAAPVALGVLILIPLIVTQFSQTSHGGFDQRADLWQTAVLAFRDQPVLGYGPESYEYAFMRYAQLTHPRSEHHAHNAVLQVMAETGTVGLIALLLLIGGAVWGLASAHRKGERGRAALGAGLMAALIAQAMLDYVYWVAANALIVMLVCWVILHAPTPTIPSERRWGWRELALISLGLNIFWLVAPLDRWWPSWALVAIVVVMAIAWFEVIRVRSPH